MGAGKQTQRKSQKCRKKAATQTLLHAVLTFVLSNIAVYDRSFSS